MGTSAPASSHFYKYISELRPQIDELQYSFKFDTETKYVMLSGNIRIAGEERPSLALVSYRDRALMC